jgi:penicillin amidase
VRLAKGYNAVEIDWTQAFLASAASSDVIGGSLARAGLYEQDLAASNNWVVDGRHSMTGKPLLANDPHLSPSAPSIWYMVQLAAPGLHVAGVTVPGAPGVMIGHNDWITWGVTNVGADVQDLYVERFDENEPTRYMTPDGWRNAEVRPEDIKVRSSATDASLKNIHLNVTATRHGPVILEKQGIRYALAWTALDPTTNELESYYQLDRAQSWQDFKNALSGYTGFPLNFVYADVIGHIGYWAAGRCPLRRTGQGTVPYDGASDAGDWIGYIPFEDEPHAYDPASGIIVTANNRTVGRSYPYYITRDWVAPYRARRIYDLLTAKRRLSVEDFRGIQADTFSRVDEVFVGQVVKIGQRLVDSSPEWQEILSALSGWNAMMTADSRVIALSSVMRRVFEGRILDAALGHELAQRYSWANSGTFFDRIITERPPEWLPREFNSYEGLLVVCYKDATDILRKRLGADESQWTWGRLEQVRFIHPLSKWPLVGARFALEPIPQNGGDPAINNGASVSMRYIADPSDWDNTRQCITLGESGDPSSPHWNDQLGDWRAVTPGRFPFSEKAVEIATRTALVLEPSGPTEDH